MEIEVDRDGLEKVGGADMSISEEIELEEVIKKNIVSAFRRVSTRLLTLQYADEVEYHFVRNRGDQVTWE